MLFCFSFLFFAEARTLLRMKPVYRKQQENFDRVLKCLTHLIYLLVSTAKTDAEKKLVRNLYFLKLFNFSIYSSCFCALLFQMNESIESIIKNNIRSACTNDTLLHLCVSRLNVIKNGYFSDGTYIGVSFSISVLNFHDFTIHFKFNFRYFFMTALRISQLQCYQVVIGLWC